MTFFYKDAEYYADSNNEMATPIKCIDCNIDIDKAIRLIQFQNFDRESNKWLNSDMDEDKSEYYCPNCFTEFKVLYNGEWLQQ